MTGKNRGKRPLHLSAAMVLVMRGGYPENSSRLEVFDPDDVSNKNVYELLELGLLLGRESLPHMTMAENTFVGPEDAGSEVLAIHNKEPSVYKVWFGCAVERFSLLGMRLRGYEYHDVALFVV